MRYYYSLIKTPTGSCIDFVITDESELEVFYDLKQKYPEYESIEIMEVVENE